MAQGRKFSFKVEKAAETVFNHLFAKQYEPAIELSVKNIKKKNKHPVFFFALSIQFLLENDSASFREQFSEIANLPSVSYIDYYNFGVFFQKLEVHSLAVECFSESAQRKPDHIDSFIQLANSIYELDELDSALGAYISAYELDDSNTYVAMRAGECLEKLKQFDQAVEYYNKVYEKFPLDSEARVCLARCLIELDRSDEAENVISKDIDKASKKEKDYLLLVKIYKDRHDMNLAFRFAAASYKYNSDFLPIIKVYATLLIDRNYPKEAKAILKRAIARDPKDIDTVFNYGTCCHLLGDHVEALEYLYKSIEIDPTSHKAYNNLGQVFEGLGKHEKAIDHYRKAIDLAPAHEEYHSNILFTMLHQDGVDPITHLAETKVWEKMHAVLPKQRISEYKFNPGKVEKLRIGYISGDFGDHVAAYFWLPIAKHHDRDRYDIYLYSQKVRDDELSRTVNERIDQVCDLKRDVSTLTDEELCQQIVDDEIHILIDLSGHTAGNRLKALSSKPAPIQASYIGYPATTGLDSIDYYITQPFSAPLEDADLYTEKLVHIPGCTSYNIRSGAEHIVSKKLPYKTNGWVTFGSFNRTSKISVECMQAWGQLLKKIPRSRLILKGSGKDDDEFTHRFYQCLDDCGVERERLILRKRSDFLTYLEEINEFDIGLDPFPYNGATTSLDLFFMGRSFITLQKGRAFHENIGASLLKFFGQDEMVSSSVEEYVEKAVWAAQNMTKLEENRLKLRDFFLTEVAGSGAKVCASLETSMEIMWKRYCDGDAVDHILLPKE